MVLVLVGFMLIQFVSAKGSDKTYPVVVLSNDLIELTVLLPDENRGYYRSTRFDWSGIVAQVEYGKHSFFQDWRGYNGTIHAGDHDPLKPGTATGTAEEFRNPLGYEEAKPGDPFLKIGVGILKREDMKPYHWDVPYQIIEAGTWQIIEKEKSISFIQEMKTDFGYAYEYEKIIVLSEGESEFKIVHTLKNIGDKHIHANPYCHNFFQFDYSFIYKDY
jgi:hypothetical protein